MVNQNKILTVSYGTFSCTLEGFDDPFSTMKAIAEYFRDLAAEDRYFGAEPPQPDAGMLKLIAEREMQRRIDAKISENSVILRASEPAVPEAPPVMQAAVASAPVHAPSETEVQAAPVVLQDPAPPMPQLMPEADDTVAAKLARIRNAVAKARVDALMPGQTEALNDAREIPPEAAVPVVAAVAVTPEFDPADSEDWFEDTQLAGTSEDDLDLGAVIAARAEPQAPGQDADFEEPWSTEGSFDSEADIEAKAQDSNGDDRDEDQDNQAALVLAAEPEGFDDEELDIASLTAQLAEPSEPAPEMAEVRAEDDALEGEDRWDAPEAKDFEPEAEADQIAGVELEAMAEPEAAEIVPLTEATAAEAPSAIPAPEPRQRIIRIRRREKAPAMMDEAALLPPEAEAELAAELAQMTEADEASTEVVDTSAEDFDLETVLASLDATLAEPALAPEAELDQEDVPEIEAVAAVAEDDVIAAEDGEPNSKVELSEDDVEPPVDSADGDSEDKAPSVEAPAENDQSLQAALHAALGENLSGRPARSAAASPDAPPRPVRPSRPAVRPAARTERPASVIAPSRPRRAALERGPDDSAEADRLLRQTNDELAVPENRRRVATIAHLKAAVAATVADRLSRADGEDKSETDPSDAFRADLAQAVRPRRPVAVGGGGAVMPGRPGTSARDRIPPLVLISEQRVPKAVVDESLDDEDDDSDTLDAPNIFAASGEFTEFGLRMGATTAADWMEAAAAHLMLKDGLDLFTRPQLIGRLLSHPPIVEKLDREAQLTLFGTLLREGRLSKPRRGLFCLSEGSAMLAQARRLAG